MGGARGDAAAPNGGGRGHESTATIAAARDTCGGCTAINDGACAMAPQSALGGVAASAKCSKWSVAGCGEWFDGVSSLGASWWW